MTPHHPEGLAPIDPLAVPLPHGTEVTTRVERTLGDRRVPQGVVGRVVAIRDDGFDVLVTGVGVVRYTREELLPRRPGQLRFAEQRAADWEALRPCVVLEATVGSRAWGLADEGSDTDLRGVFVLPFPWTVGLLDPPATLTSADGSITYWEHRKAIEQAVRADPNTLELLFVHTVQATDPIGEWLLEARDAFASADLFGSFGRYAVSQLGKLSRSARLAEHRGLVLDWLRVDPPPSLDAVAGRLAAISPRPAPTPADGLIAAKEYVKQLYRSLFDQGLLDANDFAALVRYARGGGKQPEPARELRPKNAYNLLRLIHVATGWLRTGRPELEMKGAVRERLLEIKRGAVDLDAVLAEAERLVPPLEAARDATKLPRRPDLVRADALLRRIGEEVARRWVLQVAGPLGADAPRPPTIREEAT
ncbi:MAG TPA: nucleotidyltransferase domain-containing protein [Anaeromyxobacteraceae bacterium]|nr:nucleotidyltransferase domain-containing protein [Anaeromyxobacteraceae bacterium]